MISSSCITGGGSLVSIMNSRNTRIEDRTRPGALAELPLVGAMPRATDGAARRTPGPQDLIPAKRRRPVDAPAARRSFGGEGRSIIPLPPRPTYAITQQSQQRPVHGLSRTGPPVNMPPKRLPTIFRNRNDNKKASYSSTNKRREALSNNGGGARAESSTAAAKPVIIISDDEDDFQIDPRAAKRLSLHGSIVQQAIEIPSSSDEEDSSSTGGSEEEDEEADAFRIPTIRKRPSTLEDFLRSRRTKPPLVQDVNGVATASSGGESQVTTGSHVAARQEQQQPQSQPQNDQQHQQLTREHSHPPTTTPHPLNSMETAILLDDDSDPPSFSAQQDSRQQSHLQRGGITSENDDTALQLRQGGPHLKPSTLELSQALAPPQAPAPSQAPSRSQTPAPSQLPAPFQSPAVSQATGPSLTQAPSQTPPSSQAPASVSIPPPSAMATPMPSQIPESSPWTSLTSHLSSNIMAVYNRVNQVVGRATSSSSSISSQLPSLTSSSQQCSPQPSDLESNLGSAPATGTGTKEAVEALAPLSNTPSVLDETLDDSKVLYEMDFEQGGTKPKSDHEDDLGEDFHYDDDYLLGGPLDLQTFSIIKTKSLNYPQAIQESFIQSRGKLLRYQEDIKSDNAKWRRRLGSMNHAAPNKNKVHQERMKVIVEQVAEATRLLRRADWEMIARITTVRTGEEIGPAECKAAFEEQFSWQRTKEMALKIASEPLPMKTSSLGHLLAARSLGSKFYNRRYIHDLVVKAQAKTFRHATSFHYGSGSIVDMAMKRDGLSFEVLVGSIATQDIYNRSGNLLLCDFKKGVTTPLTGHEVRDSNHQEPVAKTVNDVKLSFSKRFFISASDDKTSKVWKTGTGDLVATQSELKSRVTRVAVCEASLTYEDVFATCSDKGGVMVYGMHPEEDRVARQSSIFQHNSQRCVSCISFGQGYYWNILAVGMEGIGGIGSGQIKLYDANVEKPSSKIQLDKQMSVYTTASISCLSFSPSGEYLLYGTSGGSGYDAEDNIGDGLMRLFDVKAGKEVAEVLTNQEDVNLVGFSPCETYLISCSAKNDIVVYDRRFMQSSMATSNLNGVGGPGGGGGHFGGAARRRSSAKHMKRSETKPLHSFYHDTLDEVPTSGISSALWWPSGPPPAARANPNDFEGHWSTQGSMNWLVTGGGDGVVRAWDIARATEDAEVWKLEAKVGPIACVMATPEFDDLVIGGDTSMVSLYTMDKGIAAQYERKPMRLLQRDEE